MVVKDQKINKILQKFCEETKKLFGNNLKTIILYGSSVSGDYIPKKSNLNLIVILEKIDLSILKKVLKPVKKWRKKNIITPLFLTELHIKSSQDVFPMEFLDIKENYSLLYGDDYFKNIDISFNNLRLECESKLKGNLIRLRQVYLEVGLKKKELRRLLINSFTSFFPIFRNILRLKNISPPVVKEQILLLLIKEFNLEKEVFLKLLEIKKGNLSLSMSEQENLLADFISQIQNLSRIIDEL